MPVNHDTAFGRLIIKMSGSKAFRAVGPAFVPRLDRLLHRLTGGRVILSGGMLPSLVLTSTGAKTGQKRQSPLATKPEDDCWYVVGSNFGRETHPAWTANLMANPEAEISYKAKRISVTAHHLSTDEKASVWPRLVKFWPNYAVYTENSGRDLRVFRLDPR